MRQRYNVTMTFEIPADEPNDYKIFRAAVDQAAKRLEKKLGADCQLEYCAIDQTRRDTILAD